MDQTLTRYNYKLGLGYKLNRAATQMNAAVETALLPHGFSLMSWIVLSAVSYQERLTVTDLSIYTGVERTAVSRTVSKLIADGYMQRERCDTDARASELALTVKGHETIEIVHVEVRQAVSLLQRDLSPNQVKLLGELLDVIQPGEEPRWSEKPGHDQSTFTAKTQS